MYLPWMTMQLPPILPKELEYLRNIQEPNQVFSELVQDTHKLVKFLEVVSDDDVWINRNPEFMTQMMGWLTQQYTQGRLGADIAEHSSNIIYSHYSTLKKLIPYNITVISENHSFPINAMLFGTTSPIFKDLIRDELWSKNKKSFELQGVSEKELKELIEFINEGTLDNLWKQSREEILEMLLFAEKWDIPKLADLCQLSLNRYIDNERVIPTLLQSQKEKWRVLRHECIDYFNGMEYPIKIVNSDNDDFIVEFTNFRTIALETYKKMSSVVTDIICRKELAQEQAFVDIMQATPKLKGIDVSDSNEFSSHLLEIPSKVNQFTAARSPWITNENLRLLINATPQMTKVHIPSAIQLTTNGWADLQRWERLEKLDLAHCHQLHDRDLQIILSGCLRLRELSLEDCRILSENGFRALAKPTSRLVRLNLSRTNLSDTAFVDIVDKVRSLEEMDISRCDIPREVIVKVQRDFPKLKLVGVNPGT